MPILDCETRNAFELARVACDHDRLNGKGDSRDEHVVGADKLATPCQVGPHSSRRRFIEGQQGERRQERFDGNL